MKFDALVTQSKPMKIIKLLFTAFLFIAYVNAYSQENPYTTWAQEENPASYANIKTMVEKVWGADDDKRNAYLIELHCLSLNNVIQEMNKDEADWDILVKALDKWSRSAVADRGENWWEWPDTNWMKVESEYRFLLENTKDN